MLKRTLSFVVFGWGVLSGSWGFCLTMLGLVMIGTQDSALEILAVVLAHAAVLAGSLLALWRRSVAAILLLSSGTLFLLYMLTQRSYRMDIELFPSLRTVSRSTLHSLETVTTLLFLGVFSLLTAFLRWPEVLPFAEQRKTTNIN